MITIKQRVIVLRAAASVYPKNQARKLLEETADVLEAQAASFNVLYALALEATHEGDMARLRAYIRIIESAKKETTATISGAV